MRQWKSLKVDDATNIAISKTKVIHCSDITWASWRPKSPAIWLFVQQIVQADSNENTKCPPTLRTLCEGNPAFPGHDVVKTNAQILSIWCFYHPNVRLYMQTSHNNKCAEIWRIMHELPWITIFGSRVRRCANNFHEWRSHEWKLLANRITSDAKIVIHGNEFYFYILHAILCPSTHNSTKTIIDCRFRHRRWGRSFLI